MELVTGTIQQINISNGGMPKRPVAEAHAGLGDPKKAAALRERAEGLKKK